jgi:hypothetical protein
MKMLLQLYNKLEERVERLEDQEEKDLTKRGEGSG